MLPSSGVLSKLVGGLYKAASDPAAWEPFLQDLAGRTSATAAALVIYDSSEASYVLSRSWEFSPEATKLYGEHYGALDVWAHEALSKRGSSVLNSEALYPLQRLKRREMYNDYLAPFGLEHGLFTVVENTGSRLASVSLFRNSCRTEFREPDRAILEFLLPHIQQAVKLHFEFSKLKAESHGIAAALDALCGGVIFLGLDGRVLFMNRTASAMVSERDGLLASASGMRAEQQSESAQLNKFVGDAVAAATGKGFNAGGTVLVSRRARPPLKVQISPIRNAGIESPQRISAVAFISDPLQRRPQHESLRARYALTPAETRVALLLADGQSPQAITQIVGVTENTVRTQIKSIYWKTGVKRQAELVRLLLNQTAVS